MKKQNLKRSAIEPEERYFKVVIIYAGFLLLGFSLMQFGGEDGRKYGPIVLLLSIGSLIRRMTRAMWAARDRRQAAAEEAKREIIKLERRERDREERDRLNLEKGHQKRNTIKTRQTLADKRQIQHLEAQAESTRQLERSELIRKEAERLKSTRLEQLIPFVKEALELPGDEWNEEQDSIQWKAVLSRDLTQKRELILVLSPRKQADIHEIEEMEALRRDENCDRGKLISVGGFSPRAVRQGSRLPITLIDAHLLADYILTPGRESADSPVNKELAG